MAICGEGNMWNEPFGSDFNNYSGIFWKRKCQRLVCTKNIIY